MMLGTLSGRLALMMAGMFLVIGGLVVAISQRIPELRQLIELAAELVVAAIAFALGAALLVFNLLTRRLHLLVDEIEAFRASRFTRPRHVKWSCADGDEVDRLAHAFGELSDHIARQIAELERLDGQRRELLANVSHDLRTPLTLMQGYLETLLLRRGELTPGEERSCLEVAARHAERLGRLVADLFELTKLDGQAGRLQAEPFSLTELAQDIAQKFTLHAKAQQVRVALELDASTPPVWGDIGLVERALENLVENALRHTPGGGEVSIEVAPGGTAAQVRVRDTGCGISRENLPHVFDRYFQAPRVELTAQGHAVGPCVAADTVRHHAGLGLAITRRIVALHGGAIRVQSALGVGTVFCFELPFTAPADATSPVHTTTRESPCPSASSSSCRVS
jgi:signal transduction histidine kinase